MTEDRVISASRPEASKALAKEYAEGAIVAPDPENPVHRALLERVAAVSEETGIHPTVYILPVTGADDAARHASRLRNIGNFQSLPLSNELVVPEAAEYFFTPQEIEAVLCHEFDHMRRPQDVTEKLGESVKLRRLLRQVEEREKEGAPVGMEGMLLDFQWRKVLELATEREVKADEGAMAAGRASDLASALRKLEIVRYGRDDFDFLPPDQLLPLCEERERGVKERQGRRPNPHTAETFAERIRRLEKAAEHEPERPSRGR